MRFNRQHINSLTHYRFPYPICHTCIHYYESVFHDIVKIFSIHANEIFRHKLIKYGGNPCWNPFNRPLERAGNAARSRGNLCGSVSRRHGLLMGCNVILQANGAFTGGVACTLIWPWHFLNRHSPGADHSPAERVVIIMGAYVRQSLGLCLSISAQSFKPLDYSSPVHFRK